MSQPCPRCGHLNTGSNIFCGQCGASLAVQQQPPYQAAPQSGMSSSTKTALIVLGVVFGACMICGIIGSFVGKNDRRAAANSNVGANTGAGVVQAPPAGSQMSTGEHLAEAKKALAEGNPSHKDPNKRSWGRVADARKHLETIPSGAREHAEAQKLLAEVSRREAGIQAFAKETARALVVEQMEKKMLSEGHDFEFNVGGLEKTTLTVKYVLMSRPLVYKLTNESDFLQNMRQAGFKKVIFTDGYNSTWTFTL